MIFLGDSVIVTVIFSPTGNKFASYFSIFGVITKVLNGNIGDFSTLVVQLTLLKLFEDTSTLALLKSAFIEKLHFENKNILGQYPCGGQLI